MNFQNRVLVQWCCFDSFRRMAPCFWTRSCTIEGNDVTGANCRSLLLTFQTRRHCKNVKALFLNSKPKRDVCKIPKTERALMRYRTKLSCCTQYCGIGVASLWQYDKLLQLAWWGHGHEGFLPVLLCFHQGQGLLDGDFEDGWVLTLHRALSMPEIFHPLWSTEFSPSCSSGL